MRVEATCERCGREGNEYPKAYQYGVYTQEVNGKIISLCGRCLRLREEPISETNG